MIRCATTFLAQTFVSLVFTVSVCSQASSTTILVDEFGKLPLGDLAARSDALRNDLLKQNNSKALIRIYPATDGLLALPHIHGSFFQTYVSRNNLSLKNRIIVQLCEGRDQGSSTQFFVSQTDSKIEGCKPFVPDLTKTVLVWTEVFHPVGFADDYLGMVGVDAAADKAKFDFIAQLLKNAPGSSIYIVGYGGRFYEALYDGTNREKLSKTDSLAVNDRSLRRMKKKIAVREIAATRVRTIRGGLRNYVREADIWFVPKGGEVPRSTPDALPISNSHN